MSDVDFDEEAGEGHVTEVTTEVRAKERFWTKMRAVIQPAHA